MRRQSLGTSVAALALLLSVSACGSADKPDPKPTKTTTSASPTSTTPTQPEGKYGVTYEIQNWNEHADDSAVLAYKQILEANNASINRGKLVPESRRLVAKPVLRVLAINVRNAAKYKWHVKKVATISIQTARTSGAGAHLVVCAWSPSTGLYDSKNNFVGKPEKFWNRKFVTLSQASGNWVLTKTTTKGKCPGGAPE